MKSANLTLCLLGKISSKDIYKVKRGNQEFVVPKERLIRAINETPSKSRNCMIRNSNIVMKPGFGEMRIIEAPKATQEKELKHTEDDKDAKDKSNGTVYMTSKIEWKNSAGNIFYNDAFFDNRVATDYKFIKEHSWVIAKIDKAELDLRSSGAGMASSIRLFSPFGGLEAQQLSTGCKTILNALYVRKKLNNIPWVINSNECGETAFEVLCQVVRGANVSLYVSLQRKYPTLEKVTPNVCFDGKTINDPSELYDVIKEHRY